MSNNIHYLVIGLALVFAIVAIIKPLTWPLAVSVLLVCIELFSRVSKSIVVIGLAGALLLGATGCCVTNYDYQTPGGAKVHVTNNRFVWTTDAYAVNFGTNGTASITVSKSGTDNATITAIVQGAIQGMAAAAPKL